MYRCRGARSEIGCILLSRIGQALNEAMSNELSEMDVNDELGEALQAVLQALDQENDDVDPYEPYPIARGSRGPRCDLHVHLRPPFSEVQFTVSPRLRFAPRFRPSLQLKPCIPGRRRLCFELRARAHRRRSVGHAVGRRSTVGVAVGPHRPPASLFLLFPLTNAPPGPPCTLHQLWPMHLK
jgi:hypothetical protein